MKSSQLCYPRGFTLVELMIVMAIVGILATLALPSYQSYLVRSRVVEGLVLSSNAKLHVADIVQSGQSSPAGYARDYISPAPTRNTTGIAIAPTTGVITITTPLRAGGGTLVLLPYLAVNTGLPNGTAPFSAPREAIKWQCIAAGATPMVPGVVATLRGSYTPADCR